MVAAERGLADLLGIARWHAVIGGSMGGMRALEWAIGSPQRLERLLLIATAARCSADNIAAHTCQIEAIRQDPHFCGGDYVDHPGGGPRQGLALARSLAQLTYLSAAELERQLAADRIAASPSQRDGNSNSNGNGNQSEAERDDQGDVDHCHGDLEGAMAALLERDSWKLVQRFDANSYITLTRAMNRHDIGRGRGGLSAALARVTAQTQVVAVSSDRLFPPCCQQELAAGLPAGATYTTLHSDLGHDGFIEEIEQLRLILRQVLG
jgi:homoserine O-acetyltransferase